MIKLYGLYLCSIWCQVSTEWYGIIFLQNGEKEITITVLFYCGRIFFVDIVKYVNKNYDDVSEADFVSIFR
jgi:hypothetical protein